MPLIIAMILDAVFGEPGWLWRRLPHPAVLMGRVIALADRRFNQGAARRLKGALVMAALVLAAWGAGRLVSFLPGHDVIATLIAAILIAQRSLVEDARRLVDDGRTLLEAELVAQGVRHGERDGHRIARFAAEPPRPATVQRRSARVTACTNAGWHGWTSATGSR